MQNVKSPPRFMPRGKKHSSPPRMTKRMEELLSQVAQLNQKTKELMKQGNAIQLPNMPRQACSEAKTTSQRKTITKWIAKNKENYLVTDKWYLDSRDKVEEESEEEEGSEDEEGNDGEGSEDEEVSDEEGREEENSEEGEQEEEEEEEAQDSDEGPTPAAHEDRHDWAALEACMAKIEENQGPPAANPNITGVGTDSN
ncbi:uncharacterized protein LOC131232434 [Magnolia sinica]|uniref:uncharacterized protein LOC131232434 n=1 Tax=Magnolia sinica TaxID=86752 RepID=UPI00265A0ABC|nr:uncharacterized protein LOC131232434 [Magnolia sinica]